MYNSNTTVGKFNIKIKPLGEWFLLISWPSEISVEISDELLAFEKSINTIFGEVILATNPAYASLCVRFNIEKITFKQLKTELLKAYHSFVFNRVESEKYWEIPVCYDPELGPDLLESCRQTSLHPDQFVTLHTAPFYRIYFIGFLPGFLYLGGLNEQLFIPRKTTPRPKVPVGAVGIAGQQTGIYPQASPGGWQLIGQTKVALFSAHKNLPTLFKAGDDLKFKAISKKEFLVSSTLPTLKTKTKNG